MKLMQLKLILALALTVLGATVIAGCDQNLGLEGKTFSCNEQSDCADGYVCDMDRQVCVSEGSIGTQDATDDATDAQDIADVSDSSDTAEPPDTGDDADSSSQCECEIDQVCTEEGQCVECIVGPDCDEGLICQNNTCVDGSCTAPTECPDGYACDLEGERCFRTDAWCRQNGDCETGQECDPSGRCVAACDSRSDCPEGTFCTLDGRCTPVSGTECTNQGPCETNKVCTGDATDPGACIYWRCEYRGIDAECRDYAYCRKVEIGGIQRNMCLASTCDPDASTGTSCSTDENNPTHCVARTEADGICERTGDAQTFGQCDPMRNDRTLNCPPDHSCLPTPSGGHRCELVCDPWAVDTRCLDGEGTCVPKPGVLGTCQRNTDLGGDCTRKPAFSPCDIGSVCVRDGTDMVCTEVCRVDRDSECRATEICNPTRVPGDIGWGVCTNLCENDGDCNGANEVCRPSRFFPGRSYCATPCNVDADCSVPGQMCKDGFCD